MYSNCYCDSIGSFLNYQLSMTYSFFNVINQTTAINLKTNDAWDIYTFELERITVNLMNINVSNQLQPILYTDHKLAICFSVFANNTIQFSPISFQIYIGEDSLIENNSFLSLKFTKYDERYVYSIITCEKKNIFIEFYSNLVAGIDNNTYILDVDQLFLENNTFQEGVKFRCEELYSNESNIYTKNVAFPTYKFENCKLPQQKLPAYIIVLISIGAALLVSLLVLMAFICYKNRKIEKAESKITLNTSIVGDFG